MSETTTKWVVLDSEGREVKEKFPSLNGPDAEYTRRGLQMAGYSVLPRQEYKADRYTSNWAVVHLSNGRPSNVEFYRVEAPTARALKERENQLEKKLKLDWLKNIRQGEGLDTRTSLLDINRRVDEVMHNLPFDFYIWQSGRVKVYNGGKL